METKKILVTGGFGFIGSWIAETLVKKGHMVYVVDDLSGGYKENIKIKNFFYSIFDLRDEKKVDELFKHEKFDIVHHLAAHPHEGLSLYCPVDIFTTTCNASINVFKACVNYDVERCVFYSSMARYGHGNFKPPFSEEYPPNPVDVYGTAKVAAENVLKAFSEAHGLEYVILVPHNIYGSKSNLADPYRNVLMIWINCLMRNKPFYIYGDGTAKRAPSYIADIVKPCIRAGFDDKVLREVINIGSPKAYTLNEIAKIVLEEFPSDLQPMHLSQRACEVKEAYSTVDKSIRVLGYEEKTTLREGIRKTINWAKKVGAKEPKYLEHIEIEKNLHPAWRDKLI